MALEQVAYKAYVLTSHGKQLTEETRQVKLDELTPEEIVVKTRAAGVCHTDIHFWHGNLQIGKSKEQQVSFSKRGITLPRVPGHEIAGDVCVMGAEALVSSGLAIGDRVLVFPFVGCGQCAVCVGGDTHMCSNGTRELGFDRDGGYAEYVKVPSYRYVFRLPEGMSYEMGAILPCSGLTAYSAVQRIKPVVEQVAHSWKLTLVIGVIGLGGLGQWGLKLLQCVYKDTPIRVIAMDISEAKTTHVMKQKLADKAFVLDPKLTSQEQAKSFMDEFDNQPLNAVLDFVNVTNTFELSIQLLGKCGLLVSIGLHGGLGELVLPFLPLKSHTITGVYTGSPATLRELLELAQQNSLDPPLITSYPLCEGTRALEDVERGLVLGRAVLVPVGRS